MTIPTHLLTSVEQSDRYMPIPRRSRKKNQKPAVKDVDSGKDLPDRRVLHSGEGRKQLSTYVDNNLYDFANKVRELLGFDSLAEFLRFVWVQYARHASKLIQDERVREFERQYDIHFQRFYQAMTASGHAMVIPLSDENQKNIENQSNQATDMVMRERLTKILNTGLQRTVTSMGSDLMIAPLEDEVAKPNIPYAQH